MTATAAQGSSLAELRNKEISSRRDTGYAAGYLARSGGILGEPVAAQQGLCQSTTREMLSWSAKLLTLTLSSPAPTARCHCSVGKRGIGDLILTQHKQHTRVCHSAQKCPPSPAVSTRQLLLHSPVTLPAGEPKPVAQNKLAGQLFVGVVCGARLSGLDLSSPSKGGVDRRSHPNF